MLTPSAFLYSCAVLNYHCKGKAAIPEGSWLGEKWQRKLEYPADCKHLSSCRLLTPLCLQLGMAFTLILSGQDLAQPLTIASWTQRDDYLCSRCPNYGCKFSLVEKKQFKNWKINPKLQDKMSNFKTKPQSNRWGELLGISCEKLIISTSRTTLNLLYNR